MKENGCEELVYQILHVYSLALSTLSYRSCRLLVLDFFYKIGKRFPSLSFEWEG
jgi:hypothetical protein